MFKISREYYCEIYKLYASLIPSRSSVLELGCGSGALLASLNPKTGLGIDIDSERIEEAREKYIGNDNLKFAEEDVENITWPSHFSFDYIILSDLVQLISDVQKTLNNLHAVSSSSTRIVMNIPSNLWRPFLKFASLLCLRNKDLNFNWLSLTDVENLLYVAGFDVVTRGRHIILPIRIPVLSRLINGFFAKLPLVSHLCLINYVVARPCPFNLLQKRDYSVSIVIPTLNERGNIDAAFKRIPKIGRWTELIFIDGNSNDGTIEEIERCCRKYGHEWKRVILLLQDGEGKGQAVRQAFEDCRGDILMILDSDLTMPPEELPKYYDALVKGYGELINGCRLIYEMEGEAMRFLNMVANYCFAKIFTWLIGQPIKDTLCGTKVLWRHDYDKIAANRAYFGDFDPFGDFDLLFGAARLNLKIVDMPIHYRNRSYGEIKIRRWKHGLLLLRMSMIGFKKLKMN